MKILSLIVMIVLLGVFANAQDPKPATGFSFPSEKFSFSTEKVVKNSPFSAEAVSESVQTLADGNRIVNKSTSKLYRNSEGRFRREMANGSGGMFGSFYSYGPGVTILDPVAGQKYMLDSNLFTATASAFKALPGFEIKTNLTDEQKKILEEKIKAISNDKLSEEQKAAIISKLKTELKRDLQVNLKTVTGTAPLAGVGAAAGQIHSGTVSVVSGGNVNVYSPSAKSKYDTKTEQLGIQNFEGVDAEGTRTTTTIPANAVGNERPIEIVYERWYSKELEMVVMSKHNDPRTGEQTYKLTNVVRTEPDPSLFALPSGYKVFNQSWPPFTVSSGAVNEYPEKAAAVKVAAPAAAPIPAPKAKP